MFLLITKNKLEAATIEIKKIDKPLTSVNNEKGDILEIIDEELFGYLMDQEECTDKELKYLVEKYRRIKDINYCIFITNKFFKNRK